MLHSENYTGKDITLFYVKNRQRNNLYDNVFVNVLERARSHPQGIENSVSTLSIWLIINMLTRNVGVNIVVLSRHIIICYEIGIFGLLLLRNCCCYYACIYNVLTGHNWMHFAHRLYCTVNLNLNFAILKAWNCFQLE